MYISFLSIGYLESSDVFLIQSLNAVVTVPPQPYGRGFFISKISGSIYLTFDKCYNFKEVFRTMTKH